MYRTATPKLLDNRTAEHHRHAPIPELDPLPPDHKAVALLSASPSFRGDHGTSPSRCHDAKSFPLFAAACANFSFCQKTINQSQAQAIAGHICFTGKGPTPMGAQKPPPIAKDADHRS